MSKHKNRSKLKPQTIMFQSAGSVLITASARLSKLRLKIASSSAIVTISPLAMAESHRLKCDSASPTAPMV